MFKKSLLTGTWMATAAIAHAATTADITVSGIIEPPACNITVVGTVDFGTKTAAEVRAADGLSSYESGNFYGMLPPANQEMTVDCEGPRAFSLTLTDNKSGTRVPMSQTDDPVQMGLGTAPNGQKIGNWVLVLQNVWATNNIGQPPQFIVGMLNRPTGSLGAWDVIPYTNGAWKPNTQYGFQTSGIETSPPAYTRVTSTLSTVAWISETLLNTLSERTYLDGSATITLEYL